MKLDIRFDKYSLLFLTVLGLVATLVVTPLIARSSMNFYSFEMSLPEEVEVVPGETVTIEGEILVTGFFWLHNFDLTVSGLPYEYELEPEWWEHVMILRDWTPDDGLFRVPEKFELKVHVPEDAAGSYIVTVTGQEHHSFREISNFTYFVLRSEGEPVKPQLSISDILVPEMIMEFEPFQMTFKVNNEGPVDTDATISVVVPEGWEVDQPSQQMSIEKDGSAAGMFRIVPTTEAGEISLLVEYPFREEVIKFTKAGPYLIPIGATTTTQPTNVSEPILTQIIGYASRILDSVTGAFEGVAGPYATSIIMGIIFVLFVIIVWLIFDIIKFVRGRPSKEPEEMETKGETKGKGKGRETKILDTTSTVSGVQIREV